MNLKAMEFKRGNSGDEMGNILNTKQHPTWIMTSKCQARGYERITKQIYIYSLDPEVARERWKEKEREREKQSKI